MFKNGFRINNLQWLMCHKTKPNQTKPNTQNISAQFAEAVDYTDCISVEG